MASRLRAHRAEPEDDGCCDADCREEGVSASVVACRDAPPVLEAPEHVPDPTALAIRHRAVGQRLLADPASGNAGFDAPSGARACRNRLLSWLVSRVQRKRDAIPDEAAAFYGCHDMAAAERDHVPCMQQVQSAIRLTLALIRVFLEQNRKIYDDG